MQLEQITAEIRPRPPYEAADLGLQMARRHWPALAACWSLTFLPVTLLTAVLLHRHPYWALFLLWWLKPLHEQAPLFYLSRALFGARPSAGEMLRALPLLLKRGLRWVTIDRLRFSRGLLMPVRLLEGADSARSRLRCRLLTRHSGGTAAATTVWFHIFEEVSSIALLVLLITLIPENQMPADFEQALLNSFDPSQETPLGIAWMFNGLYLAACLLLAPFYVGAGFGLYLNARTLLEGWDIELAFRRIGRRLTAANFAAAVLLIGSLLAMPPVAGAREEEQALTPATQTIRDVLAHPDFEERTVKVRRFKPIETGPSSAMSWAIPQSLTLVFLGVVVALAVAGLVYLLRRYLPGLRRGPPGLPQASAKTTEVSLLDRIDAASLPDDVLRAAREAFAGGRRVEALSLLYRGAIRSLVDDHDVRICAGDTETDCLNRLAGRAEEHRGYLQQLVEVWVAERYARSPQPDSVFENLCRHWPFSPAGATA